MVARHKQELDLRQREVDQLTTLSLRGDATVQEYMAGLKVGTEHKALLLLWLKAQRLWYGLFGWRAETHYLSSIKALCLQT